jgi:hypothetical protein
LPLVEYLKVERGLVYSDAKFVSKDFITGILLINNKFPNILKVFIYHSEGIVATTQCSIRRIPDTYD